MRVWPVIGRELRAQSRQRFTYWLRTLGMTALLVAAFVFAFEHQFASSDGAELFMDLHFTLFCAIWILVPLSAADCISRERREGTLGLLFLTPLRPPHIIVAKSIAHGLRATTLLMAVLPALTLPFLVGGITWQLAAMSALIQFSSICWALATTLVASALCKSGLRALVMAAVLTGCAMVMYAVLVGEMVMTDFRGFFPMMLATGPDFTTNALNIGFALISMGRGDWQAALSAAQTSQLVIGTAKIAGVSVFVLLLGVVLAARAIRHNWREMPPPIWMQRTQRVFLTPVLLKKILHRWLRWQLVRNPLGWLERRHWLGRLIAWSWLAIAMTISSIALTNDYFFVEDNQFQTAIAWLMMGSMAVSIAGSFRRERESGALELLLVTPLSVGQIIGGRLRGLWGQFLPAVVLYLGVWAYYGSMFGDESAMPAIIFFSGIFLTLPIIGLYFSVRCRNYVGAFLLTAIFSLLLPFLIGRAAILYVERGVYFYDSQWPRLVALPFQFLMAGWFCFLLFRRLERRNFPMERASP